MICVTIAQPRHRGVLAQHKFLAERGVKLVELRLDYLQTRVNFERLLGNKPTPVIITIRRPEDGGQWKLSENARQMLLRGAIVEGVDYVDLEDGLAAETPRYGKTQRIVSYHDFRETPENLDEIFERLAGQDPDIVKICTQANSPGDAMRMLESVERWSKRLPTVGFCMGDMGIPSRVLCARYGSPFTYCACDERSVVAPGQVTLDEMQNLYRIDKITDKTRVYGVLADPVGHSLSPLIHNAAFAELGMDDRVYLPMRVPREHLESTVKDICPKLGVKGLSVTIPHKEAIIPMLDRAETGVKAVGACNTVLWDDDGTRVGLNTDYQAAMSAMAEVIGWEEPNDDPETGEPKSQPLAGKTALILGAGGVGKAIAVGLARRGAEIILTDAVTATADDLAFKLTAEGHNARSILWGDRHFCHPDIVANCTPIGMYPHGDATPFEAKYMQPEMTFFDAVYNPENTLMLKDARAAGCATVSGLTMFVLQAGLQFQRFTGAEPPLDAMREVVKKATSVVKW